MVSFSKRARATLELVGNIIGISVVAIVFLCGAAISSYG